MTTPRPVLQALWSLHRGIYAVSGGRLGTTRPGPGDRLTRAVPLVIREPVDPGPGG